MGTDTQSLSDQSTFIFDSKLTTYENLSRLNLQKIKFITLRRRGHKLVGDVALLESWKRINIPHDKRKYPQPMIHETRVELRGYEGELRQIVLRGFEACDAPKIYRHFVKGKGVIEVRDGHISVNFPKRAHNPILRSVAWQNLPQELPWLDGANLSMRFS